MLVHPTKKGNTLSMQFRKKSSFMAVCVFKMYSYFLKRGADFLVLGTIDISAIKLKRCTKVL